MATAPHIDPLSNGMDFTQAVPMHMDAHLDTSHPDYISYTYGAICIEVIGGIRDIAPSSLRVTIKAFVKGSRSAVDIYRSSQVNLFDDHQVSHITGKIAERLKIETLTVKNALYDLIERLENHRRNRGKTTTPKPTAPSHQRDTALAILKSINPLSALQDELKQAGNTDPRLALQLYILSLSRITAQPLHGLIQAPRLLAHDLVSALSQCLPKEKRREATTISKHALSYPPTLDYWDESILVLHQSNCLKAGDNSLYDYLLHGRSHRLVTQSNRQTGKYESIHKELNSSISLLTYTHNDYHPMQNSRNTVCLPLSNTKILSDQRYEREVRCLAGYDDPTHEHQAQERLQQIQRELQPYHVRNPLIEEVDLSGFFGSDLKNLAVYLRIVNLITLIHQHRDTVILTKTSKVVEVKAVYMIEALELFREVWLKKDDELYFNVRATFKQIKEYLHRHYGATQSDSEFTLKEIRKALKRSPVTLQRHLHTLEDYGKIQRTGGNNRNGYRYLISEWDEDSGTLTAYEALIKNLKEL